MDREIDNLPKQSGGNNLYPSRIYTKILLDAEDEAKKNLETNM